MIRFQFQKNLNHHKISSLRLLSDKVSTDETVDCVSASHSRSNLRLIRFGKQEYETQTEKQLRLRRIALQEWNHNYWSQNNYDFQTQKSEFIENELKSTKSTEFKSNVSYDELSLFYKRFLDTNHKKHMNYNLEWYKRHTSLLWPSFKVFLIKVNRKFFSNK